ncbi:Integral membrane protein [hydrothermal vent metagenome]|uniref:Integral membrane protein n=1 Tax=hydrothermal vent metagenome TaxID=652676 RepID=A0A1W1EIQ4_9ZZZZ
MKHFYTSIVITIIGLIIAFYLGGLYGVYITALLAVLEVSLSFDNAVVNAKVLETMEPKWQKRFITFGIPIAVFGMRFIFPILIVSIASSMGFMEAFNLALNEPEKYHHTLESTKELIYAFGGSFLLMVFLDFFFDEDREEKWIKVIEEHKITSAIGDVNNIELMFALVIGLLLINETQNASIAMAYFGGVFLHSLIASLDELLSTDGVRSGIMGFLYLEILDASFSFDGVIGAFALSSDIFIIMMGLGIGAMFVRSLTLYFVEMKTLSEFRYLEHGAHYAILALALVMFIKMFFEVSEIIVGTVGIGFIGISLYHSIKDNRKEESEN